MNDSPRQRVLVVDDEMSMRETMAMTLNEEGYEVSMAINGLDALRHLRLVIPSLILSDLNMPLMSGFEFLTVVRRRFPSIPVIAMSGSFDSSDRFPGGILADAFYAKGRCHHRELIGTISALIQTPVVRTSDPPRHPNQVQVPRYGVNSQGANFILLTCTECLRSISLTGKLDARQGIQQTQCQFCSTGVSFLCGSPLAVIPQMDRAMIQPGLTATS